MLLKMLLKIWQNYILCLLNIYQIFGKVLTTKFNATRNNHLPVLPGNEEDFGHDKKGKTYLF